MEGRIDRGIPGLPCRLLSTGTIQHEGGEFWGPGRQGSYLRFRKDRSDTPLAEKKKVPGPVGISPVEWQ